MPFDVSEGIDCIIYGDILEHLRDPWAVLERQAEALTPDGVILICIPNLEHWSFAETTAARHLGLPAERAAGRDAPALVQPAEHARGAGEARLRAMRRARTRVFDREHSARFAKADRARADGTRHRCRRLRQARRAAAICLARAQKPAAAHDDRGQYAEAGRRRIACADRASAAGDGDRPLGRDHAHLVGRCQGAGRRRAAHFHPASPRSVRRTRGTR